MSNVKISALPAGTSLVDTDTLPVVRAGVTTKVNTGTLVADVATLKTSVLPLTPLDQSTWAWYNQGSATVSQGTHVVHLESDASFAEDLHGRIVNQPATPYTIIAQCSLGPLDPSGYTALGIGFSDGTKAEVLSYASNESGEGPKMTLTKQTDPTTNSSRSSTLRFLVASSSVWFKITNDGVNMTLSYSFDGQGYTQYVSEALGTFLTPSKVGIFVQNFGGAYIIGGGFQSWAIS